MKALRVGSVRRVLCASPRYLEQHGKPADPALLVNHTIIAATGVSPSSEWKFRHGTKSIPVRVQPKLTVNSNDAAIAAAESGLGITRLLSYQIAPQVMAGRLKIILPEWEPAPMPIHVIHREGRYAAVKVRAFVDFIAEKLRNDRALRG
jgi:DNA-binding transcriptional LysR family regulator